MNIKAIISFAVVLLLLFLDWAALHDIIKGEPDLTLEYAMVASSLIVVPFLLNYLLRKSSSGIDSA